MAAKYSRHVAGVLDEATFLSFQERCSREGISNSEGIRQAVEAWLSLGPAGGLEQGIVKELARWEAVLEMYRRARAVQGQTGDGRLVERVLALASEWGVPIPQDKP